MTRRVYFIKPIGMDGPVKIGCSRWPEQRRDTLATWSPFPLEVVAELEGDLLLERRFHAKFLPQHLHREWFNFTPELGEVIAAICAGTFDHETLPAPGRIPNTSGRKRGSKWSEERKAANRRHRAFRRIEQETGLVLPWGERTDALEDKFLADPHRYGVTREERERRWCRHLAEQQLEAARETLAELEQAA